MRWGTLILIGLIMAGCAAKPVPSPAPVAQRSESVYDRAAVAGALVYDPPVIANAPRVDVSREGRAPAAFAGYEDLITTYYYLYQSDYQIGYGTGSSGGPNWRNNDRFERQAITQRVGVSYR